MANLLFFNVERGHRRPRKFRLSNNSLIDDYTDEELRARYRFGRQSILYITNLLARDLRRSTARNHALTPLHQVLIALRFFASGSFLQVIGDTVAYTGVLHIRANILCHAFYTTTSHGVTVLVISK